MNIITASGRAIDPANPRVSDIDLHDIAVGLSTESRFGARTSLAHPYSEARIPCRYSVAQHCVLAANLAACESLDVDVDVDVAVGMGRCFVALLTLHDASEAYLGDIIHPLKVLLPDYQALEAKWERVIFERFSLLDCCTPETMAGVKEYDQKLFRLEASILTPDPAQYFVDMSEKAQAERADQLKALPFLRSIETPWSETRSRLEFLDLCKLLNIS